MRVVVEQSSGWRESEAPTWAELINAASRHPHFRDPWVPVDARAELQGSELRWWITYKAEDSWKARHEYRRGVRRIARDMQAGLHSEARA